MRWLIPLALSLAIAGCDRSQIEAVNLSNEGDQAQKGGDLEGAIAKYEEGARLDADNHRIHYRLVKAYRKKENWEKVVEFATKAEKADEKLNSKKTFAPYYFEHGYALSKLAGSGKGKWADAKQPLETAVQIDPNLSDAYFELAEVLLRVDDEKGALENYTKAVERQPSNTSLYPSLADLYLRLQMVDAAEQVLKEGLSFAKESDKHLFELRAFLGMVYARKGDNNASLREFEAAKKACGACEEHREAYFYLGSALAGVTARKNEAINELNRFQKLACSGSLAKKFGDQCSQARDLVSRLGGQLQ